MPLFGHGERFDTLEGRALARGILERLLRRHSVAGYLSRHFAKVACHSVATRRESAALPGAWHYLRPVAPIQSW